jgi:hypothetical protein
MLRPDAVHPTDQTSAPEGLGEWNGASAFVTILAAQVYGAMLVVAVACWRSAAARMWTLAATAVLLIAAGVLFTLGDDERVLARSILIVAACVAMVLLDAAVSKDRPPSFLCAGAFGAWISFAVMIPIMVARPYDSDELWAVIHRSPAVETVQWMTLVGVISFGSALLTSRFILWPVERWWARIWDSRLVFAEQDGGFTLAGIVLVGVSVFLFKIVFVGSGFLGTGSVPVSMTWVLSGLYFVYYVALYAANARMLGEGRLNLPTVGFDLVAFAYEIASGSKGRFAVYVLFPLMLVAVFQKRRLSWYTAGGFGSVVGVAVLVVYPLLVSYRAELSESVDPGRPNAALMVRASGSWSDSYEEKIALAVARAGPAEQVLASTSLVYFDVRHDAQRLWERLAFFWIPRALWPEKAESLSGGDIGKESHRLSLQSQTAVLQTGIGELYVYFGVTGALGLFLTGLLFRLIDVAYSCFRFPQSLRIGASIYAFRELSGVVTGDYEPAMTIPFSSTVILLSLLSVLALAASLFSGALGESVEKAKVARVDGTLGR